MDTIFALASARGKAGVAVVRVSGPAAVAAGVALCGGLPPARRAGLRPISVIVDVTNYVMLELGQPMHAYDLREVAGGIVVRRANPGETLRLLDGRDVTLDDSVLVIADHAKPLGLAGIMGGEHSGIGAGTIILAA